MTVLRPSTRLICEMCWTRNPAKSLLVVSVLFARLDVLMRGCARYMRVDTLAQMLTIANVHSGCDVLLVESCQGLVTGAVLERLGGENMHGYINGRFLLMSYSQGVCQRVL